MSSLNRRRFLSAAAAANANGAFRGQAQSLPAKSGFHLGSVTYNLLKDYDVEPLSRLWKRWDSRPWNCGPDISTA